MISSRRSSAFSIAETLITVAVAGVLAAIGTLTASHLVSSARAQRLASDIETLNRAVAAHVASGGDLSQARSPAEVVAALKQPVAESSRMPGFGGTKIDERLSVVMETPNEAARGGLRAYWDASARRFVLADRGTEPGIKAFQLDPVAAPPPPTERKANTPFLYAETGSWIWDYAEGTAPAPAAPSEIPVGEPSDTAPPATPGPSGGGTTVLSPPTFSLAPGAYPIASFDLPVAIHNPNPTDVSELYYSLDFGNWRPYTGPLAVAPGTVVAAQAISTSALHRHSQKIDASYTAVPADLLPPVISPSRDEFGLFADRTLSVTLSDLNSPGISRLEFRIGGDPWQTYTGPFDVSRSDYPSGALVQARAVPTDPNYLASTASLRSLGVETPTISGNAGGAFSNPTGDKQMETNLGASDSSDYFAWGKAPGSPHSRSWLDFDGLAFDAISEGNRFRLGTLTYFNGTIVSGTGATGVTFTTDLAITLSGVATTSSLSFDFELVNVANRNDPKDPWADADFVRLASPVASQVLDFNGLQYQLVLEFGQSTDAGLALFDEFHVLENESATTNVYGTLVEIGTIDFNR